LKGIEDASAHEGRCLRGSGVGAVVQFDDKSATWFFEDELKLI